MADRTYLELPFLDDAHRTLECELDAWCTQSLHSIDHADTNRACRQLVRALGQGGWLRYCVPASYGGALPALDSRALCIVRETLARHHGPAQGHHALPAR